MVDSEGLAHSRVRRPRLRVETDELFNALCRRGLRDKDREIEALAHCLQRSSLSLRLDAAELRGTIKSVQPLPGEVAQEWASAGLNGSGNRRRRGRKSGTEMRLASVVRP